MPAHSEVPFNDPSMINKANSRANDILISGSSDGNDVISEFYEDATVFITGSTGFIGKLLIEKLLRDFLIKRIYLLVRTKDNMTVETRLDQLFEDVVFDRLRKERPDAFKKVKAVEANFAAKDLSISKENRELLRNEVNIVFNVVASVKFNEKLRDAVEINLLATQKILNLTKQMKNLKTFLHVSTFFSNCDRNRIDEKLYKPDISYEKMIQITELLDDTYLDKTKNVLCQTKPNTYTLTKSYSEDLVQQESNGIPSGIFRPPILIGTYKEPFAGWTDNLYGPAGMCLGVLKYYIFILFTNPHCQANLAPADYCVNAILSAAWDINRRFKSNHTDIPIYNYVSQENSISWGKYAKLVRNGLQPSLRKIIWNYTFAMIHSKPLFNVLNLIFHGIPAIIMECFAIIMGKERIYIKNFQKINRVMTTMAFFDQRDWKFSSKNVDDLANLLRSPSKEHCNDSDLKNDSISKNNVNSKEVRHRSIAKDKTKSTPYLEFELRKVDWDEYFLNYVPGILQYHERNQKKIHGSNKA